MHGMRDAVVLLGSILLLLSVRVSPVERPAEPVPSAQAAEARTGGTALAEVPVVLPAVEVEPSTGPRFEEPQPGADGAPSAGCAGTLHVGAFEVAGQRVLVLQGTDLRPVAAPSLDVPAVGAARQVTREVG